MVAQSKYSLPLAAALALLLSSATGCIAQTADETEDQAATAEGTTHVDGEEVETLATGVNAASANPVNTPQPSPWRPNGPNPNVPTPNVDNEATPDPSDPGKTPQPSPWHPPIQPTSALSVQAPNN
jgi:hypothetical protein